MNTFGLQSIISLNIIIEVYYVSSKCWCFHDFDNSFGHTGFLISYVLPSLSACIKNQHQIHLLSCKEIMNPLTNRVKPWVIQSFLTFDSMARTLKCDHSLKNC